MPVVADIQVEYADAVQANAKLQDTIDYLDAKLQETRDDLVEQVKARAEVSDVLDELYEGMKKFDIMRGSMVMELKMTKIKLAAAHHTMARMERAACKRYKRRVAAARQRNADLARMIAEAKAHGAI